MKFASHLRMLARIILPILAGIGLILGIIAVIISRIEPRTPPIPFPPPEAPFEHYIAASGMVEASSHDIHIGSAITEIMEELFVEPGDLVPEGTPLFKLRNQVATARVAQAQAALAVAEAKYQRLLDLPRAEDIAIQEAFVESKKAHYLNALAKFELVQNLTNPQAISRDEYNQRRFGAMEARFTLKEAQEDLSKLLAGTWVNDLNISRAELKEAQKRVEIEKRTLEESIIKAPFTGVVLRINRFVGELVAARNEEDPIMLFGVIDPLNVRVDIDEEEIWRIEKGAPGIAYVRGNRNIHTHLKFLRIEPYLVPKRALNGTSSELVDTRVLQVIYELRRGDQPIYPGQLLDVYLEAKPSRINS